MKTQLQESKRMEEVLRHQMDEIEKNLQKLAKKVVVLRKKDEK